MTRAMDSEVADAIWATIEPILPSMIIRSAVTTRGSPTECASVGS